MIGQKMLVSFIIKQVMKAIEKASDKQIASGHEKRIKALEKIAHPRADFICMKCGCKAKRVEKVTKKRRK
tara:strand:- start:4815 stop:5024 length:210 start_codon:yes stop_codon:yes gene_type:complete